MRKLISTTVLILLLGLASLAQNKKDESVEPGRGTGRGDGISDAEREKIKQTEKVKPAPNNSGIGPVRILSKPSAVYTDLARQNQIQGKVLLQVTFQKNGKIGKIRVISGLADGLTANAIEAAKKIKFQPQTKNGKPVTVTKNIQYTFTLY